MRCIRRSNRTRPASCWWATVTASTGRPAATPTASRSCSCTADPAAGGPPGSAASSIRSATASCCSISEDAGAARPTRSSPTPTCVASPQRTSSPTSSCCVATSGSPPGRCSADRGAVDWPSPTPRRTPTSSPNSCCVASSRSVAPSWSGFTKAAPRRSSPTCGRSSSRPSRRSSVRTSSTPTTVGCSTPIRPCTSPPLWHGLAGRRRP